MGSPIPPEPQAGDCAHPHTDSGRRSGGRVRAEGGATGAGPAAQQALEAHAGRWAAEAGAVERRTIRWALPGWVLLGLGAVLLCLVMNALRPYAGLALPAAAAGLAAAALWIVLAGRYRRRAAARISADIRTTCEREGWAAAKAVHALVGLAHGRTMDLVLEGVEPNGGSRARLLRDGEEAFRLLSLRPVPSIEFMVVRGTGKSIAAVILQGEHRADEFARIAADGLAHDLYGEAVAALAMVDMIYHEIAPPAPLHMLQGAQEDPLRAEAAEAVYVLFSGFDLLPEMAAVVEAHPPAVLPSAHDDPLVGRCIEYIARRTQEAYKRDRAWELLAGIPDVRTIPYLLAALEQRAFFPEAIAGLGRLGEEAHAGLLAAVQTGRGRLRFHASMALGMLQVEEARPVLSALLPSSHSPVERAGLHFALARLGEEGHSEELLNLLEESDVGARQAAAIALAYADHPIEEEACLRHLEDECAAVRLHLVRKLAAQGAASGGCVEALVARLEDRDDQVREAAVEALRRLDSTSVRARLAELAGEAPGEAQLAACRVLGATAGAEAVPLLVGAMEQAATDAHRRALLQALGETGTDEAARTAGSYLDDPDLSGAAFSALQRISVRGPEAARRAVTSHPPSRARLLVLAALSGDAQATGQLAALLRPRTQFLALLDVLEIIPQLRSPLFVAPLRELLAYRNHPRFPGDRSISYLALKALVHSELAGE